MGFCPVKSLYSESLTESTKKSIRANPRLNFKDWVALLTGNTLMRKFNLPVVVLRRLQILIYGRIKCSMHVLTSHVRASHVRGFENLPIGFVHLPRALRQNDVAVHMLRACDNICRVQMLPPNAMRRERSEPERCSDAHIASALV
jgi:hypothetical protein